MSETQRAFWFGTIVGAFVVWGCLILVVALTTTAVERPARGDRLPIGAANPPISLRLPK